MEQLLISARGWDFSFSPSIPPPPYWTVGLLVVSVDRQSPGTGDCCSAKKCPDSAMARFFRPAAAAAPGYIHTYLT